MDSLKPDRLEGDFFAHLQNLNATQVILSQWTQLEKTGCINNFRIIADKNDNFFREGYYFADSDAYKWLDAACRIQKSNISAELLDKINYLIDLIIKTQDDDDGYIYTYNQIHFPGDRWKNMLREHELYCMGHLIEAGISHYKMSNDKSLLNSCEKVADLLVRTFLHNRQSTIPGHEEIELALLKLYKIVPKEEYVELARQFIERRGRLHFFWFRFIINNSSTKRRIRKIQRNRTIFYEKNNIPKAILPESVEFINPKSIERKFFLNFASGKYIQSHKPIRNQDKPEGHAVRFTYLMAATAMYSNMRRENELVKTLEDLWKHMITKKMFVTGGIGQLPYTEGFDADYQLDPKYAYCESCAGIGSLLWNWQMTELTYEACYADLFEWQFYNAVLVGLGQDGQSYFYRNPLEVKADYGRKEWYSCPCCPPNISRTIASIEGQIVTFSNDELWLHQYITSTNDLRIADDVLCTIKSSFPFDGTVDINLKTKKSNKIVLNFRIPSWCDNFKILCNEEEIKHEEVKRQYLEDTACGYNPFLAYYYKITLNIEDTNLIRLIFQMPIKILIPDKRVKSILGKATVTRGPLVYCLEQSFNSFDIFTSIITKNSLKYDISTHNIIGLTSDDESVCFTPYITWATDKPTPMTVFKIFE